MRKIEWKVLNVNNPEYTKREFMTITIECGSGMEFQLPYVTTSEEAETLWKDLARVMTKLEAFIGRCDT